MSKNMKMSISEAIATAQEIIPYRYNVSSERVQAAQDTIWQAAKDGTIAEISEYGMTRGAEKRVIDNARYEIWHAQSELLQYMDIDPEAYDCEDIEDMTERPNTFSLMQNIIAQGTSTAGGTSCWKEIYAIEEECGKFGDTD